MIVNPAVKIQAGIFVTNFLIKKTATHLEYHHNHRHDLQGRIVLRRGNDRS